MYDRKLKGHRRKYHMYLTDNIQVQGKYNHC